MSGSCRLRIVVRLSFRCCLVVVLSQLPSASFACTWSGLIPASPFSRSLPPHLLTTPHTSQVGVRVEAEEMSTGLRRHCCSAYLTFVSLKAKQQAAASKNKPTTPQLTQQQQQQPQQPQEQQQQQQQSGSSQQQDQQQQQCMLSRVSPQTAEQQRIHAQAESRRQQRLAARQAAKDDPHKAALLRACRLRPVTHR